MPKSSKKKKEKSADFRVSSNLYFSHIVDPISAHRRLSWSSETGNSQLLTQWIHRLKLAVSVFGGCFRGQQQIYRSLNNLFMKMPAITLPNQSITVAKSGAVTTKRKLTLDELIIHLKHHNATVRRGKEWCCVWFPATHLRADAILGLRELLENFPDLKGGSLTMVVNACVRIVCDEVCISLFSSASIIYILGPLRTRVFGRRSCPYLAGFFLKCIA